MSRHLSRSTARRMCELKCGLSEVFCGKGEVMRPKPAFPVHGLRVDEPHRKRLIVKDRRKTAALTCVSQGRGESSFISPLPKRREGNHYKAMNRCWSGSYSITIMIVTQACERKKCTHHICFRICAKRTSSSRYRFQLTLSDLVDVFTIQAGIVPSIRINRQGGKLSSL